jgi:Fe2+ transport system protein FeoA
MKLFDVPVDTPVKINNFSDSLSVKFQHRLREIGFVEGEMISCIRKTPFGGPGIFKVGGSIFSLGSEIAEFIMICPLPA